MRLYVETSICDERGVRFFSETADWLLEEGAQVHVELADHLDPAPLAGCAIHKSKAAWEQTWAHRPRMVAAQDDFDLFIYLEADIRFLPENLSYFEVATEMIADPARVLHFIRYEAMEDGRGYLVDSQATGVDGNLGRVDDEFFLYRPEHCGMFAVSQASLKLAIKNGWGYAWEDVDHTKALAYGGIGETAASEIYLCGLCPVIHKNLVPMAFVEHKTGNYWRSHHSGVNLRTVQGDGREGRNGLVRVYYRDTLERLIREM